MSQVLTERGLRITERQREVVELVAAGLSNDEVGERLGISPRTAKAHCDVLRQKLGVSRRRQIPVAYRLQTGEDPLSTKPRSLQLRGLTAPTRGPGRGWGHPTRPSGLVPAPGEPGQLSELSSTRSTEMIKSGRR